MTPPHIIQRVKDAVDLAALVAEHVQPRGLRNFPSGSLVIPLDTAE